MNSSSHTHSDTGETELFPDGAFDSLLTQHDPAATLTSNTRVSNEVMILKLAVTSAPAARKRLRARSPLVILGSAVAVVGLTAGAALAVPYAAQMFDQSPETGVDASFPLAPVANSVCEVSITAIRSDDARVRAEARDGGTIVIEGITDSVDNMSTQIVMPATGTNTFNEAEFAAVKDFLQTKDWTDLSGIAADSALTAPQDASQPSITVFDGGSVSSDYEPVVQGIVDAVANAGLNTNGSAALEVMQACGSERP